MTIKYSMPDSLYTIKIDVIKMILNGEIFRLKQFIYDNPTIKTQSTISGFNFSHFDDTFYFFNEEDYLLFNLTFKDYISNSYKTKDYMKMF